MTIQTTLDHLREQGIFSDLEIQFAQFITHLAHSQDEILLLSALLASHVTTQGHVCVDLERYAGKSFPFISTPDKLLFPTLPSWLQALATCSMVGMPSDFKPLILDANRLYLYRYWHYEHTLATCIRQRACEPPITVDFAVLQEGIARLFPTQITSESDQQRLAAINAVTRNFCIISGGPGTGKTSTVVKILALLLEQNITCRIALVAPTGKAAARLQEAIAINKEPLNCADAIKAIIPQETYTIHRLLGTIPNSPYFRHDVQHPLLYDVIVVDEASMVDLPLMAKLAQALLPQTRWILLGDKDQLASVEVGTVLGDICDVPPKDEGTHLQKITDFVETSEAIPSCDIRQCIVVLEKNYRFSENSGIGKLAKLVQQGEHRKATLLLKANAHEDLTWRSLPASLSPLLAEAVKQGFAAYLKEKEPQKVLAAFDQFRVLCALRHGSQGVVVLNQLIEQLLNVKKQPHYRWYHRQPIMITRNDYTLRLFNGDIGVILWNPENRQELLAFFPSADGGVRTFWPHRLPEHETVYALTIHKSQGSEFNRVLVIFPEQPVPILTRELIYTAITRARSHVTIWGNESVLQTAIAQRVQRSSGLREALSI